MVKRRFGMGPVALCAALLVTCSCNKKEPEGYRVMSYDSKTHEWTILRTGWLSDGESNPSQFVRNRMVVVCNCRIDMRLGRKTLDGTDACNLQVGRLYATNGLPGDFVRVYEPNADTLSIQEGGAVQQFAILKNEVLP